MTAVPFNEATLRADITARWGEHGAHADVYDHLVKRATESVRVEAICAAGCQDCVTVTRRFDPAQGWVWIVDDCLLTTPMHDHDLEVLSNSFIAARKALTS